MQIQNEFLFLITILTILQLLFNILDMFTVYYLY
jgi:hypothetical protein